MSHIRVAVVDDHPLFLAGVVHALDAEPDITVVGEGSTAEDALHLAKECHPDIIVLDVNMPGGGMKALEGVLALCPDTKPMMLSGAIEQDQVRSAMQKGAWGFVLKGVSATELARSIRLVHAGERYITPVLAARLFALPPAAPVAVQSDPLAGLTSRERRVLTQIALGLSNKEIGLNLSISEKTVKHYVTTLLDKLGVSSRVQTALVARRRSGLTPSDSQ
jgi:DNA-binding NarL/FixJ family response regulator